ALSALVARDAHRSRDLSRRPVQSGLDCRKELLLWRESGPSAVRSVGPDRTELAVRSAGYIRGSHLCAAARGIPLHSVRSALSDPARGSARFAEVSFSSAQRRG